MISFLRACYEQKLETLRVSQQRPAQTPISFEPPHTETELVKAIWNKEKMRVSQLLHIGEDPNKGNLLPKLVMCRIPVYLHLNLNEHVPESTMPMGLKQDITEYAEILVKGGAKVDAEAVAEFKAYQTELERRLKQVWERVKHKANRTDAFDDQAYSVFAQMANQYANTQNPYIQIMNAEAKLEFGMMSPSKERTVCRFAAQLLLHLQQVAEDKNKK
jgi:hypothetical protein